MSENKFQIGDTVIHKANPTHKMIIIGNCNYRQEAPENLLGNKNPSQFLCRSLKQNFHYTDKCYYAYELQLYSE